MLECLNGFITCNFEAIANSEEPDTGKVSTSSSEVETQEILDFDLSEFDILDGDFSFSELLIDLDLAGEVIPSSEKPSLNVDSIPGSEHNIGGRSVEVDRLLPDSSKSTVTDALEDINIQGPELSTSIRAITKRIKIVSPVKIRKNCPVEQIDEAAKAQDPETSSTCYTSASSNPSSDT